jgi:hypothetical protein
MKIMEFLFGIKIIFKYFSIIQFDLSENVSRQKLWKINRSIFKLDNGLGARLCNIEQREPLTRQ